MPHTITIGCQCKSQVYCNDYFISVTFQIILYGIKKQLNSKFRDCNRLKPGIHDTSFASKSPFMKTWIKKTWIQVCVYTMQEILMNTHKFLRDTTNKMAFLGGEEGAALWIALLCTIVLRRRLSSKTRSTWARKWLRRQRWDVFLWSLLDLQSFH
jgi:hypothetical protein